VAQWLLGCLNQTIAVVVVDINPCITEYSQGRRSVCQCKSSYRHYKQYSLHCQTSCGRLDDDDDDDNDRFNSG
jgi:hypothetical protein